MSSAWFLPRLVGPQFPHLSKDTGNVSSNQGVVKGQGGVRKSMCGFSEGPELPKPQAHMCAFKDITSGEISWLSASPGGPKLRKGKEPLSRIIFHFWFNSDRDF